MVYYNENNQFAAAWLREIIKAGLIADGEVDERSIEDVTPMDLRGYDQCHLFAGIGGWSYALRLAGWPDDRPVWTGSCPCQPFSSAGKGGGFADERHLWPAWYWLIGECRPGVIFGEQVASRAGLAWFDLVSADLEGAGYAVGAVDLCAAGVGAPHIRQRLWFVAESASQRGRVSSGHRQAPEGRQTNPRPELPGELQTGVARSSPTGLMAESRGSESGWISSSGWEALSADGNGSQIDGMAYSERDGGRADESGRRQEGRVADGRVGELADAESGQWEGGGRGRCDRKGNEGRTDSNAGNPWGSCDWLPCRDGKARSIESLPASMADGLPSELGLVRLESYPDRPHEECIAFAPLVQKGKARVGRLRGYGNAIVPQVAAEVIRAYMTEVVWTQSTSF